MKQTIELLVTRLLKTMLSEDVTLANCFRRVLEAIAGGLLLKGLLLLKFFTK